jgi:hypothetical protein
MADPKLPLRVKHRWMGAIGCLVALALIVLIAVVAGWLGQWGIFAPEKDQLKIAAPP